MKKDILGREELEGFDVDLNLQDVTLLSTRCCATGTCNGPATIMPYRLAETVGDSLEIKQLSAYVVREAFGSLRPA